MTGLDWFVSNIWEKQAFWTLIKNGSKDLSVHIFVCCARTHLLHFCSIGKGTATRFLVQWFVLQPPKWTQFYSTTDLCCGWRAQDELWLRSAWTGHLNQMRNPLYCGDKRSLGWRTINICHRMECQCENSLKQMFIGLKKVALKCLNQAASCSHNVGENFNNSEKLWKFFTIGFTASS